MNSETVKRVRTRAALAAVSLAALSAALLAAAPAMAQSATASPQAEPSNATQEGSLLGEVVITAQFRREDVQKTPLAVTAVTGDQLRARNINSIADLSRTTPNVTLAQGTGIRAGGQNYIRGIGQNDFNFALEPGVGVYVDDVYYGTTYGAALDLIDVDRVEVLRGPQGTLAGGNNIGGAIKLFSKRPMGGSSGYFEAGYGSNNQFDLRGAFDATLSPDKLFLRVSGALRSDNGYVDRIDFACANPALAGTLPRQNPTSRSCFLGKEGGQNVRALRTSLRWLPTDKVEVNIIGEVARNDMQPGAEVPIAIVSSGISAAYQAQQQALYGVQLDSRFIPTRHYTSYATFTDLPNRGIVLDPNSYTLAYGVTGIVDWKLGDGMSLKSITGYRDVRGATADDVDGTPLNENTEYFRISHKQFTEEVRLSGRSLSNLFDWTVGGFYYDARERSTGFVDVPFSVPQFGGLYFQQDDPVSNKNYAGFATVVAHVTDKLDLTAGYRWTHGDKVYTFSRYDPRPNGAIYVLGINKLGASPPSKFSRSDYRAVVDYNWTDTFRTYASYSTGYKGGGINPRPSTPAQEVPFGPESLRNYEAGFKSELLDRRLHLNGAVFISKYNDLQVSARTLDRNGVLATIFTNVGAAKFKGVELETIYEPTSRLSLNGAFSYLYFHYDSLGSAAGIPGGPCLSCKPVMAPEWKASGGVQYRFDLAGFGELTPRLDVDYQSKVYSDPSNHEATALPERTVFNTRLTWRPKGDPAWEVALQVSNLFNRYYYVVANDVIGSSGVAVAQPGRPREVFASIRHSF